MPCDRLSDTQIGQIQIREALRRLEAALEAGTVSVAVGEQGAIAFQGWGETQRNGLADVCAYRKLAIEGSWALRLAVQRAEVLAGRKVNPEAVAAGVHSHDGGRTWGPGH